MVTMAVTLRAAEAGDGRAIASVHVETWRVAYVGIIPAEVLDGLSVDQRGSKWEETLAGLGSGERVEVAEDGGLVVGFAFTGACRDEDAFGLGELYAIYVAPSHWGAGVGSALLASARRTLVEAGHDRAVLWVLEDNKRARSFYDRDGWLLDGAVKSYGEGGGVRAVRYSVSL
jgi:ribosomal protein S18 acetylase RimI-like enzyme